MGTMTATVWILGAGFSQALGAPLFRDLFRSEERIKTSGLKLPSETFAVLALYRQFGPEASSRGFGQLWRDPEEFIDHVESALAPDGSRNLLQGLLNSVPVETIADVARRALAVECSLFLRGANPATEKWLPYRIWANRLTGSDTVMTFNYDRVLEVLYAQRLELLKKGTLQVNYAVIAPKTGWENEINEKRALSVAPVFKLHGSVDWVATGETIDVNPAEDLPATCGRGSELVLGVPGPGKIGLRDQFQQVRGLWNSALAAVKEAERIIFLGYRFPPTDARARVEILGNMKLSADEGRLKQIQVVLGPDDRHQDVMRMKHLLSYIYPTGVSVEVVPLYVEDFLSLRFLAPKS